MNEREKLEAIKSQIEKTIAHLALMITELIGVKAKSEHTLFLIDNTLNTDKNKILEGE